MKILVVSLLRLGDILLATPVIKKLREKNPKAQIHLLINSQFKGLAPLIPNVDEVLLFDRENIQKSLGDPERSLFEAYDRMETLVDRLQREEYDQVFNLTHNRLSGWITTLARGTETMGLCLGADGLPRFGSPWFRYLNNQMSDTDSEPFHFVDVFLYGSGIRGKSQISLNETHRGRKEAETITASSRPFMVIQPLTSDSKKTWSASRFEQTVRLLHFFEPEMDYVFVGAHNEALFIEPIVQRLRHEGLPVRGFYCSLEGALSLLKKAKLFLTGDTSIKHLACATAVPIVELSIGSSVYQKTGAYQEGSIIIQSSEPCAPCPHRSPCSRTTHACAETLSPDMVALVCRKVLEKNMNEVRKVAREYVSEAHVYQVLQTEMGYWGAISLSHEPDDKDVGRWLDLSSWKLYLHREHSSTVGEYGTEAKNLKSFLKNNFPSLPADQWSDYLEGVETELERFESKLGVFLIDFKEQLKDYVGGSDFKPFIQKVASYSEKISDSSVLASYARELQLISEDSGTNTFARLRKMNDAIIQSRHRADVELRIVRALKKNLVEAL